MTRILTGVFTTLILSVGPALAKTAHHTAAAPASDETGYYVVLYLLGCALLAGLIAKSRGRNIVGWVIAGFLLNIFGVITALIMTSNKATSQPPREQQNEIAAKLAQIQSGRLTPFIPAGVMPAQGEQFYWEQRAQYGQTFKQRVTSGSSPAMYLPLGHGVRMRVGGWNGASQRVSNFAWGPMGTVYVSNIRVLFKADNGEVAQAPFYEILTYDVFPDGISLNVLNIGVMQFKTGDECIGAVFLKMVQGPPKDELAPAPAQ